MEQAGGTDKLRQLRDRVAREEKQLADSRAELISVLGTTARAQLVWLLGSFAHVDLTEAVRRGEWTHFTDLGLQLSELVRRATGDKWAAQPPHISKGTLPYSPQGDRVPWRQLPAEWHLALEEARRARRPSVEMPAPDAGRLVIVIAIAQRLVRDVLSSVFPDAGREGAEEARRRPAGYALKTQGASVWLGLDRMPDGDTTLTRLVVAPLHEAIVAATLALLTRVPASLIRRCPFAACGRLFVGSKSQRWCRDHQTPARRIQWQRAQQERRVRQASSRRKRTHPRRNR